MKESSSDLKSCIMVFANRLGISDAVKEIVKVSGIYSTIQVLISKSFVDDYDESNEKDIQVIQALDIIRRYCQEMDDHGEVKFDQKT